MDLNELKQYSSEDTKTINPVNSGARIKEKSDFQKMIGNEISDGVNELGSFAASRAKHMVKLFLDDLITNGIKILLWHDDRPSNSYDRRRYDQDRPSYRKYYDDNRGRDSRRIESRDEHREQRFSYNGVEVESKGKAVDILIKMEIQIEEDGDVSVGHLYDYAQLPPPPFTYWSYGWNDVEDIRRAKIAPQRGGWYEIRLPQPKYIGRR